MIHESLAYTAFAAAGVPASRTATPTSGSTAKNYGLHLNLESLDNVSLPKIFGTPFDSKPSISTRPPNTAPTSTPAKSRASRSTRGKKTAPT